MRYAIQLANGELQPITESSALTNQQADALLGGGAKLVCIAPGGRVLPLDVLGNLDDERGPHGAPGGGELAAEQRH